MWSPAAAAYLAAPIELVDAGDATLAVRRFGCGPALLLVHGFPLHGFTWRHLLPELSARFTCVVADLAGLGDSRWTNDTDFGWEAHAQRLQRVMVQLGTEPYHVIAQDTGASIARCLTLRDRTRVRSLVIINTEIPGHRPPWIRTYQRAMLLPGAPAFFRMLLGSRTFLRSGMGFGGCFVDLDRIDGEFHAQFVAPYVDSAERTDGMGRYLTGLSDWSVVDAFAHRHRDIVQPTLLLWGEQDPTFPIARAREMPPQLPACRGLVPLPGAKLLPHEEVPAAVCRSVLPFLDSIGG